MTKYIKETTITHPNQTNRTVVVPATVEATDSQTIQNLIYFVAATVDVLLIFRLILKFMGANSGGAFVNFLYKITNLFIFPFEGIFRRGISQGIETTSVFEPSAVVAIIIYAFAAWGIVKLIQISSGESEQA